MGVEKGMLGLSEQGVGMIFVISTIPLSSSVDDVRRSVSGKAKGVTVSFTGKSGNGLFPLAQIPNPVLRSSITPSLTSLKTRGGSLSPRFFTISTDATGLSFNKWNPKPVIAVAGKSSLAMPFSERKERSRADGRQ